MHQCRDANHPHVPHGKGCGSVCSGASLARRDKSRDPGKGIPTIAVVLHRTFPLWFRCSSRESRSSGTVGCYRGFLPLNIIEPERRCGKWRLNLSLRPPSDVVPIEFTRSDPIGFMIPLSPFLWNVFRIIRRTSGFLRCRIRPSREIIYERIRQMFFRFCREFVPRHQSVFAIDCGFRLRWRAPSTHTMSSLTPIVQHLLGSPIFSVRGASSPVHHLFSGRPFFKLNICFSRSTQRVL